MNKLINNINLSDCVGDSLGKINYNVLSLDTAMCNLSSLFFNDPENYNLYFSDLNQNIQNFNTFADYFEYPTDFNKYTTATKYLSSYWNKNEITFTFPVNLYQGDDNIRIYVDTNYPTQTLNNFGLNKLNSKYPAKNFLPNTIANVIFLLYSNNTAQTSVITTFSEIGTSDKIFNIRCRKDDVYIKEIKLSKYKIDPTTKIWTYF
jgi:hypothetical protein